jgi:hypothetical protein
VVGGGVERRSWEGYVAVLRKDVKEISEEWWVLKQINGLMLMKNC